MQSKNLYYKKASSADGAFFNTLHQKENRRFPGKIVRKTLLTVYGKKGSLREEKNGKVL